MPPKDKAPRRTTAARKTTATGGGVEEPGRFTAGTGSLADDMAANGEQVAEDAARIRAEREAGERSTVAARGIYLQPLDADGAPVGERKHLGDATATVSFQPPEEEAKGLDVVLSESPVAIDVKITDPATVAMVREMMRIPIPTAVVHEWFPAFFHAPDGGQPWIRCRVFLAPQGLYVYRNPPEEEETFTNGASPAWFSPVDYSKTPKPVSGYAAMNAGIPIMTAAGKVIVQPTGGCRCNTRSLRTWTPAWSRNRISWTDAVAMVVTTEGS